MLFNRVNATIVSLSARAVAKYCDEHVCLSVTVCLSVCPTGYLRSHTRDLYQIFVHGRGSVLRSPSAGDETPRGRGNFGGFPPH